jgi:hypothetical protein
MKSVSTTSSIGGSTARDSPSDVTDLSARSRATFADAVLELGAPK